MSNNGISGEEFYKYAMDLFLKSGHTATSEPEYINHSAEQFIFFDNNSDAALSNEQRKLIKVFNNVSHLFTVNKCSFFSINLLTHKKNRSQVAHDIHSLIHYLIKADGTICLFRYEDEVMLTFKGFGSRCFLSDWYPIEDEYDCLLGRLDIANLSINRAVEYFTDMVYSLARSYYLYKQPLIHEIIPLNYKSAAGADSVDWEELDKYVESILATPLCVYGDDYVEYNESVEYSDSNISEELSLMLLDIDEEHTNPFGEEIEPEGNTLDEDDTYENDTEEFDHDQYEYESINQEIFNDPTLLVKLLKKMDKS